MIYPAFNPVGKTAAERCSQFETACRSDQSHTDEKAFWVAVFVLGIDEDVADKSFHELAADYNAPAEFLASYTGRDTHYRILASLKTVRRRWGAAFWHDLDAHGVSVPTNPPVHFSVNLSKLAKTCALDEGIIQLRRTLQNRYPGPADTLKRNGVRPLQNADVVSALSGLKERGDTAQPDEGLQQRRPRDASQPPPRKRPRTSLPSPERARRNSSRHTSTTPASSRNGGLELDRVSFYRDSPFTPRQRSPDSDAGIHTLNLDPALLIDVQADPFHPTMPPKRKPNPTDEAEQFAHAIHALGALQHKIIAARAAVEAAAEALQQAKRNLAEIVNKCHDLPALIEPEGPPTPSCTPAPSGHEDAVTQLSTSASARLDTMITRLEQKKDSFDSVQQDYATFFATLTALPGVSSNLPSLQAFQNIVDTERKRELETLRALREQLREATRNYHSSKDIYATKLFMYKKLQASWAESRSLREWEPEDFEDDVDMC
ncbi:hypothetical protein BDU57DRAFT_525010 [Ampelomyces quisqualis]|uniref:Uncharacterized protein n=1 Tax=Ampelomyces quisqualis TaxID=50730 RepID=A0A6A5Q7Q2_AMPQU|nr:hypothetical protein BDU57DRAFT_525010 [Ampelomyces quisqualis]